MVDTQTVLKGYKKVRDNQIQNLKPNDLIKYSVNSELKHGGMLKRNAFPKYLVLANYGKHVTWCVQLTEPTLILWVRTKKSRDEEKARLLEELQKLKKKTKG